MERRNFIKGAFAALGVGATFGLSALLPEQPQKKPVQIGCANIPTYEEALKEVGAIAQGSGISFDQLNESCRALANAWSSSAQQSKTAMTKLLQSLA
jgi:hypothetical protein